MIKGRFRVFFALPFQLSLLDLKGIDIPTLNAFIIIMIYIVLTETVASVGNLYKAW